MIEFAQLGEALLAQLAFAALLTSMVGVALGLVFGAMPGLNQGVLMAITLPLTIKMDPLMAQYLLLGMYVGGVSGGLATSVLLGIPGTPASVMTALDGHAMARRGLAHRALSLGIMASFLGGMVSWLVLASVSVPLASLAVRFSQYEMAALVFGGLMLIATAGGSDAIKGLIAGTLGVLVALVGLDPVSQVPRFTFGFEHLETGFGLFPVLMGIFAVGGVIGDIVLSRATVQKTTARFRDVLKAAGGILRHVGNVVRSGLIGTWIGILPGIGANIGAILAYMTTKNLDRDPASFGSGSEEGVVASEAGNNATIGGSLVPMLSLGIPGTPADVFLIAALIYHGINLGPLLVREQPEVFYGLISSYLVANVLMLVLLTLVCVPLARLAAVPRQFLVPAILLFTLIGTYSLNNQIFDVWVMLAFGVVGLVMRWIDIPPAPFVIGFVLTPIFEGSLRSAMMDSDGSFLPFVTRPASAAILAGSVLFILLPVALRRLRRNRALPAGSSRS